MGIPEGFELGYVGVRATGWTSHSAIAQVEVYAPCDGNAGVGSTPSSETTSPAPVAPATSAPSTTPAPTTDDGPTFSSPVGPEITLVGKVSSSMADDQLTVCVQEPARGDLEAAIAPECPHGTTVEWTAAHTETESCWFTRTSVFPCFIKNVS